MNFSTEPPCASTIPLIRSKYRANNARSASGSVDSPSSVEPVMSQKTTVTVFLTSRAGTAASNGVPHLGQKFASSAVSCPQLAQIDTSRG
jgi:hypothetical protein